ncbi:MAG: hypothetical protein KC776_35955 [Myxococcales bacterium]|nr:hypothetical protein [Myxococcales bacterium]MCB9578533.1 hypothetical protein [Polyangiaceae bacterium]
MASRLLVAATAALALALGGCKRDKPVGETPSATPPPPPAASSAPTPEPEVKAEPEKPDPAKYAWLGDDSLELPKAVDTLASRFATPPGYERVKLAEDSFGAWLRHLPLAAPGTPVTSHKGDVVHPGNDDYLAAVVAIDVGKIDLQQSPDVAIRLHAEWLWSQGVRNMSYRGATGLDMPLSRWARGERLVAEGRGVAWIVKAKASEADHAELRRYLDAVFTWANSTSLAQQATPVDAKDVAPGDFFVHLGSPGHAMIVLDIAEKPSGQKLALLGQALNPAQSIYVVRLGRATAWFSLRPGSPLITPYTEEFSWEGLRRLPRPSPDGDK